MEPMGYLDERAEDRIEGGPDMKWGNLMHGWCPACNADIQESDWGWECHNCRFSITRERMEELQEKPL